MKKTKVSIIVPVYNVEQYLERCIDSLLAQTLQELEIILIDDESSDSSPQICDKYAEEYPHIKVIHKKNEGLGLTRNTGLKIAQGEYISFIDSDDYIDPDMMERLYSECVKEELDIIYSEINPDQYPGFRVIHRSEKTYMNEVEKKELLLDLIGAEPTFPSSVKFQCSCCVALYDLSWLRKKNIRFNSEKVYISEDLIFNIECLLAATRVKTVPWSFYHYCLNKGSLTHIYRGDRWDRYKDILKVIKKMSSQFNNKNDFTLRWTRLGIRYSQTAILNQVHRKGTSLYQRIKEINLIAEETNKEIELNQYPISRLPLPWMIYTFLLKYKIGVLLYILLRLK